MFYTPYDRDFCRMNSDKQVPNYWSLTNQGEPSLPSNMNTNGIHQAPASWVHTVPTYMPWANKPSHMMQPGVMRFTASVLDPCTSQTATSWELVHNLGQTGGPTGVHPHLKRRSESPDNMKPAKQFVSEERMAARFNQMHISNEYTAQTSSTSTASEVKKDQSHKPVRTLEELEEMLANEPTDESDVEEEKKDSKGGLVLAPEIQKLVDKHSSSLTKAIINDINKPSMAVVLWQPPGELIKQTIKGVLEPSGSGQKSSFEASDDLESENNNSCNIDLNTLDSRTKRPPSVFSFSSPTNISNNPFSASSNSMEDELSHFDQMDEDMDDL